MPVTLHRRTLLDGLGSAGLGAVLGPGCASRASSAANVLQRALKQASPFTSVEEEAYFGLQVAANRLRDAWAVFLRSEARLTHKRDLTVRERLDGAVQEMPRKLPSPVGQQRLRALNELLRRVISDLGQFP